MDAERWQWMQTLFHQAAELPPSGRQEFLTEACAGDSDAMLEVLSLLEQDSGGETLLDRGMEAMAGLLGNREAHRTVGPYRVSRLLGEGGMGVVYLGERDDLDHRALVEGTVLPAGRRHRATGVPCDRHPKRRCRLPHVGDARHPRARRRP